MKRGCISFDKYSNTNFLYFSIPVRPSSNSPTPARGSRCARNVTSADNAIHPASHLHQKIDQSLPASSRISRNLNELRIHQKRTTPTTNTFLPNLLPASPSNFSHSPPLATKKLAKVAVLAQNSSLKKIQAITSGSSSEAGGREAVMARGQGECDDGGIA